MITAEELLNEWEQCGAYLRRKDASPEKPSILLTMRDILEIAHKAESRLAEMTSDAAVEAALTAMVDFVNTRGEAVFSARTLRQKLRQGIAAARQKVME